MNSIITSFLRRLLLFGFVFAATARADLAADYAALVAGVEGQSAPNAMGASPGGVAPFGGAAFPVLLGTGSPVQAVMAAGRYSDSYDAGAARAVAWSHTGFFDTAGGVRTTLFSNAVLWASRQSVPAGTIAVVVSNTTVGNFLTAAGYTVRSATATITAGNLSGAHVLVLSAQTDYSDTVMALIASFTAGGGGIVTCQTPWAAAVGPVADARALLDPFGLVFSNPVPGDASWTIPATAPPAIQSALPAADALIADKEGTTVLSSGDRTIAANAIFQVVQVRIDISALAAKLAVLGDSMHYGLIAPTAAASIITTTKPVEKMLAQYQSKTFDVMTPAELFVHPSAADFPGLPDAGAATVSRTVSITGNTFVDFYMNQGNRPTRFETALYAPPGATITVTIPSDKIAQGLEIHIAGNGSQDQTFNSGNGGTWTFFPKLWRRVALTAAVTQTGHVLGGLITILVPEGKTLGTFDVTIDGAIEAPAFVLGQTTDAQWNAGIKSRPAPYGYIQNSKLTIYLPKWQLAAMDNPTAVTGYWKQVMDIADEYYGYTAFRKRGETYATARYVAAGGAYAGYPIEAGWGTSRDQLLNAARVNGDWGSYHELGHGYQNNFDSAFVIAIGAEVDVNLFPGMIYTMLHDRTAWDGAHSSYDATNRLAQRNVFLAQAPASQTWQSAHDLYPVAYDFYFNLAEAFGWQVYKTALTRMMNFLQNPTVGTDAELFALSSADPNFKRNRFYLLFCDASGRNLDLYFQRYGLGAVGKGYEITQTVKDQVAAKGYPSWTDNTAIDSLSNPTVLNISESTPPGTEVYQFVATDAEEPGSVWDFQITAGNTDNAFSIDRRTGRLRVQKIDAETLTSYALTVQVQDCGLPRFSASQSFTVNIADADEAPQVEGRLCSATSAMSDGTSLGGVVATIEPGRTLASFAIVAGNDGHFAIHPTTGVLTVSGAATLPNPGVLLLTIRVEDSTGAVGFGKVTVVCNRTTGVLQEFWSNGQMVGTPTSTSTLSTFNALQNVGSNFIRRVSGWLIPQTTGPYTFWIASDDQSIFSLSPDENAVSRLSIGSVDGSTSFQSWDQQGTQKSGVVHLQAGLPYYLEAIHREGTGSDHVAVAWQGPGIARQVIPTTSLIPRDASASFPSSVLRPVETWRIAKFGASAGVDAVAGFNANPEQDGADNLVEYSLGTDPLDEAVGPLWQVSTPANRLTLSFTRNTGATDLTTTVQGADSPAGPWADLARSMSGGAFGALLGGVGVSESGAGLVRNVEVGDLFSIGDPAHPNRFLRLLITTP
ncbi:MAG: M60 family metallopeptidase [Chthoniobacteraceae bacterium]